ncbi:uncharacterized protein LOC103515475 [Diaphorina citri]|uniref:Uncharacterized protein LOC103515475 n=1 Tax=Diaphorina citri TaxID=121845 RepID=A0A3Q0J669_DIACI|nr:uncharacterized protein LOC103515475 [Diaphorina citri]
MFSQVVTSLFPMQKVSVLGLLQDVNQVSVLGLLQDVNQSPILLFFILLFLSLLCLIFQVSVLGLLQDVNQVKTECEDLKQELGRVHELKTQISKDMQSQVYVVNDLFAQLRSKIINHANNLQAVSKK